MADNEEMEIDAKWLPPRTEDKASEEERATTIPDQNAKTESESEQSDSDGHEEGNRNETISESGSVLSDVSQAHDAWSFNALLLEISAELEDDEFEKMKSVYIGKIGRGALEKMKTAMQLFDVMRRRELLTSVNLLQLCALLKIAKRIDLIQHVAEYAMKTADALYISPATLTPVNGYTHVQFHVRGRDFTRTTRRELHNFRNIVAAMLSIPTQFVLIDGVNPSSSITVTLLIPDVYATVLQSMLEIKNDSIVIELIYAGVDRVTVGEKTFIVQETDSNLTPEESEQKDIALFELLQASYRCLANTELENVTLKEQLNHMKEKMMKLERIENEMMSLQAENDVWRLSVKPKGLFEDDKGNHMKTGTENDSTEQKRDDVIKALENFKAAVDQMSTENCNKQLVLKLLQAHVTLIATRCYHELSALIISLMVQMQGVFDGMISTVTIAEIRKFMGHMDVKDVKEEPVELKALRKISSKISLKEQHVLEEAYRLDEQDKEIIESGIVPFLFILLHKEHEETKAVNMIEFLRKCLTKIDRTDLLLMFVQEVRTLSAERTQNPTSSQKSETDLTKDKEFTMESIAKNVKMLVEKVDKIDSRLTAMHAMPSLDNITNMKGEYANILYKHMNAERAGVEV